MKKSMKPEQRKLSEGETSETELKNSAEKIYDLEYQLSQQKKDLIEDCIPVLGVSKTTKLITIEAKLRKKIADRVKTRMENR